MIILLFLLGCLIVYTMVGYPLLLLILDKIIPHKSINFNNSYFPSVSIIIPAHNEEKVVEKKIRNLLCLEYPKEKLEIIVASDNSTDTTENIVESLINEFPDRIILYRVKERKGKTNAQDEAVNIAKGEVLVMTDANSMLKRNAVKELVLYLSDISVGYVAGQLIYANDETSATSQSESAYWNLDMKMRQVESDIGSITAGNGSIYAIRKKEYIRINPIYSHDSIFPPKFVLMHKRAVYNPDAIAYEKAGENDSDEFQRKVRMSRKIIAINFVDFNKYNIFKYGWFSFFYFSHRACRNNLYLFHSLFYIISWMACIQTQYTWILLLIVAQTVFYLSAYILRKSRKNFLRLPYYYCLTIAAQFLGAFKELTGKSKPFWEKAESTR
ncbi:glycosyltransferase family 2 protein [Enterococcus sp. BWB1-3]|uniref:glycosyltransferase family 2 protein n=1 Tax=Enterococcus sp. BWB1-3 TaxID=2787713 RepID=UPI002ED38D50